MNDATDAPRSARLRAYRGPETLEAVEKTNAEFGTRLRWAQFGGMLGWTERLREGRFDHAIAVLFVPSDGFDPLTMRCVDHYELLTPAEVEDYGLLPEDLVAMQACRRLRERLAALELDATTLPDPEYLEPLGDE
jgi:hypothetical protein